MALSKLPHLMEYALQNPQIRLEMDIRGLKIFLQDYASLADHGYVIANLNRPEKIADNITAIPWQDL